MEGSAGFAAFVAFCHALFIIHSNKMQLEENKIYHMDNRQGLLMLPEKSVNLIIADPPYFEVKGDFDFIWKSFDEYLEFMEEQAKLYKRVLADNGTLFVWGDKKRIAYIQVIFDRYFKLENSLVWRKVDSMQYQYYSPDLARTFNTHNERLLMYSFEYEPGERVTEEKIKPRHPFALYLKGEFERAGVTNKEIANLFPSATGGLTGCVSNWLTGANVITKEQYLKIREYLNGEYLRAEYEYLRAEYEDLRRPFYNILKLEEVLEFSQEGHKTKDFDHETVKPEKLTRALILICSRENDLVLAPFAGSGTECAMAAKENRRFIGFDIEKKYVDMANKRAEHHLRRPSLFSAV